MGELKPVRYGANPTTFRGAVGRDMVQNAGNPSGAHREAIATAEAYRTFAADMVNRGGAASKWPHREAMRSTRRLRWR